tara:strand:+ start:423 stop:986 length:564 start_codon:yes stop_codon:yes gene_type:complete
MEININNFIKSFIFIFVLNANYGYADGLEQIEINFVLSDKAGLTIDERSSYEPLKGIDIPYNKIFKYQNNRTTEIQRKDLQQLQSSPQNLKKTLSLKPNEFIKIRGVDNREKLFDGSIIIEFDQLPDLDSFADTNEILFVSDLSDINRGVFKVINLYELEDKISKFKLDSNILSIELDTIDPSITSK